MLKDLYALDLFYKGLGCSIQSLMEGVTTEAVYRLRDPFPVGGGGLHIRIQTLFGAIARPPLDSPLKHRVEWQLTFGQKGPLFLDYVSDVAKMFGLTEIIWASLYVPWDRLKCKCFITSRLLSSIIVSTN